MNPYSLHFLLTNACVSKSTTANSWVSLVYPSSFHLVVASIPILDPRLGKDEAGSRVSVGVLSIITVSRFGSALVVIAHNTSLILCTSISGSTTTNIFVRESCPIPHKPIITFFAWPGYRFFTETTAIPWNQHSGGIEISTTSGCSICINGKNERSITLPIYASSKIGLPTTVVK